MVWKVGLKWSLKLGSTQIMKLHIHLELVDDNFVHLFLLIWSASQPELLFRLCFATRSTLHTGLYSMLLNWKMICLRFDFLVPLNRFITCNTWRKLLYITFQYHVLWFYRLYWLAANLSWVFMTFNKDVSSCTFSEFIAPSDLVMISD